MAGWPRELGTIRMSPVSLGSINPILTSIRSLDVPSLVVG